MKLKEKLGWRKAKNWVRENGDGSFSLKCAADQEHWFLHTALSTFEKLPLLWFALPASCLVRRANGERRGVVADTDRSICMQFTFLHGKLEIRNHEWKDEIFGDQSGWPLSRMIRQFCRELEGIGYKRRRLICDTKWCRFHREMPMTSEFKSVYPLRTLAMPLAIWRMVERYISDFNCWGHLKDFFPSFRPLQGFITKKGEVCGSPPARRNQRPPKTSPRIKFQFVSEGTIHVNAGVATMRSDIPLI